jgi:hypothetical protein
MRIFDGGIYKEIGKVPERYFLRVLVRGMGCVLMCNGRRGESGLELLTEDGEVVCIEVDSSVEIVSSSLGSFDGSSLWFVRYKDVEVVEIETKLRL